LGVFREVCGFFDWAVLPYYSIRGHDVSWVRRELPSGVRWVVSSVMPDELLLLDGIQEEFVGVCRELGVRDVIVWDMPTYLNDYKMSERNTEVSVEWIRWFVDQGFNVIPLIKGAFEEHIRFSVESILGLGFDVAAFHITEYLTVRALAYPEIPEPNLTLRDLMFRYIDVIREYDFKQIVLIGGSSPRIAPELLDLDDRIVVCGLSWFIDARSRRVYNYRDVESVLNSYFECSCPYCRFLNARDRRIPEAIAMHNLYMSHVLLNDYPDNPNVKFYDLILDEHEDMLVVGGVYVGNKLSGWRILMDIVDEVEPSYLVFMGCVLDDSNHSREQLDDWTYFTEWLIRFRSDFNLIPIFMRRGCEWGGVGKMYISRRYPFLYHVGQDPIEDSLNEYYEDKFLIRLARLYNYSKYFLRVKKNSFKGSFIIGLEASNLLDKGAESCLDDLKSRRRYYGVDWLISTISNQVYLNREFRVAIPGEWISYQPMIHQPKPGLIYITRDGEVKQLNVEFIMGHGPI